VRARRPRHPPWVALDVLADVFSALRIGGLLYAQTELHAPWGMSFERPPRGTVKAGFHVVVRGACWLRPERGPPLSLLQGDVVLLPLGWRHTLADTPTRRATGYAETLRRQAAATGHRRGAGPDSGPGPGTPESGESTRLVCGAYELAPEGERSLLSLLPGVLHIPGDRASESLRATVSQLAAEAGGAAPGAAAATARLMDLLFIHVLRAWTGGLPEGEGGWLGALREPRIARALALIHADPRASWSLTALARSIGASRATLARRFTALVGVPPLAYVTRWRMALAGRRLRESTDALAQVAASVGYQSEFAFNRAFRREMGMAPGMYRSARGASSRGRGVADPGHRPPENRRGPGR